MSEKLDTVLRETLRTERRATEFELIKTLEQSQLLPEAPENSELALFQKHFIVRNALYRWREELRESGETLLLGLSDIELGVLARGEDGMPQTDTGADKLAEFYLDWQNFESHGEAQVEDLLNTFWRDFARYQIVAAGEVEAALKQLGLQLPVSLEQLKKQYKKLAQQRHPDRGGVSEEFVRISEAYQTVRVYLAHNANQ
jgi:DnaJ-domain-containing protein 1